jgi:hypothetical protein
MKATLIIPSAETGARKYPLTPRQKRRKQPRGFRILNAPFLKILDALRFRDLRDILGASIETDDVEGVARALRISRDEPGIVSTTRRRAVTNKERRAFHEAGWLCPLRGERQTGLFSIASP